MTVAEFIAYLQTQPQDAIMASCLYSEQRILETSDIKLVELCKPRRDGWIHDARPDKPKQQYLLLPGN